MSIDILSKSLISFIVLVLLQVFIFNNIGISSLDITPAFFIFFVLMLPFDTPKWILLITSFLLGIVIDLFSNTGGLNAFSTVFVAYFRSVILQYLSPRGGYDAGSAPRLQYFGVPWFLKYSTTIVFLHQFTFYFLENFGFSNFLFVFTKVIIGSIFSVLLIFISQFILFKKQK